MLLFVAGVLCPLLLAWALWKQTDAQLTAGLLIVGVTSVFYFFLKYVSAQAAQNYASWLISAFCLLLPLLSGGAVLYLAFEEDSFDQSFYELLFLSVSLPCQVATALLWLLYHSRVYGDLATSRSVQRIGTASSLTVFVAMVVAELLVQVLFMLEIRKTDYASSEAFYLYGVQLVGVPLFTLAGTAWSTSDLRKEDKVFYMSLAMGLLPLPFAMWLYFNLPECTVLFVCAIVLPNFAAVYWGVMAFLWERSHLLFRVASSFGCVLLSSCSVA